MNDFGKPNEGVRTYKIPENTAEYGRHLYQDIDSRYKLGQANDRFRDFLTDCLKDPQKFDEKFANFSIISNELTPAATAFFHSYINLDQYPAAQKAFKSEYIARSFTKSDIQIIAKVAAVKGKLFAMSLLYNPILEKSDPYNDAIRAINDAVDIRQKSISARGKIKRQNKDRYLNNPDSPKTGRESLRNILKEFTKNAFGVDPESAIDLTSDEIEAEIDNKIAMMVNEAFSVNPLLGLKLTMGLFDNLITQYEVLPERARQGFVSEFDKKIFKRLDEKMAVFAIPPVSPEIEGIIQERITEATKELPALLAESPKFFEMIKKMIRIATIQEYSQQLETYDAPRETDAERAKKAGREAFEQIPQEYKATLTFNENPNSLDASIRSMDQALKGMQESDARIYRDYYLQLEGMLSLQNVDIHQAREAFMEEYKQVVLPGRILLIREVMAFAKKNQKALRQKAKANGDERYTLPIDGIGQELWVVSGFHDEMLKLVEKYNFEVVDSCDIKKSDAGNHETNDQNDTAEAGMKAFAKISDEFDERIISEELDPVDDISQMGKEYRDMLLAGLADICRGEYEALTGKKARAAFEEALTQALGAGKKYAPKLIEQIRSSS